MTTEVAYRRPTQNDFGGVDVILHDGWTVQFNAAPGPSHGTSYACARCGAYVTDWLYQTDRKTNEKARLPQVNLIRHAEWHLGLGDSA